MTGVQEIDVRPSWNKERLQRSFERLFNDESMVVLANREPVRHERDTAGELVVRRADGGLVTALEPLLQACSGVWVAHGSGSADRAAVEWRDGVNVRSSGRPYRLRRVWLNDAEERGYYFGFANEGLWPMCHRAHVQPIFRRDDFDMYATVNARFARTVCEEVASDSPVVLVQDYHFALAPRFIRDLLPSSTIATFWHIPWPQVPDFEICPWAPELLDGLLGSSIMGFQTPADCRNFMDTVELLARAEIDRRDSSITYNGQRTAIRAYPVSVDWPGRWMADAPRIEACRETVRRHLDLPPDVRLGVGVDRLDYTKGICEKFAAIEHLLEVHPEFRRRFVFVQIASPSRDCVPAYRDLRARVQNTTDRINRRFGTGSYRPLILLESHHDPNDVYRFLRAADLCYVGSLHDGMNLVAKEFVCARDDDRGVLILSKFAGAAQQLHRALQVNPYAVEASAHVLARALHMSDQEQVWRMRALRLEVAEFNTYWWAGQMLQDLAIARQSPGAMAPSICTRAAKVPA